MEITTDLIIGLVLVIFSLYTLVARQIAPNHFAKLKPMKEYWGEKKGVAIHIFAYTVIPMVAGLLMLFNEFS